MYRKPFDKFYTSTKWLKLRESILKRDKYQDQIRKQYSLIPQEANVVHHIFPKDIFPEYTYCKWNLISVSHRTHSTLHSFDKEKLSKKGFELLRRTALKNNIDISSDMERLKEAYPYLKNVENPPR